jgi:hypothetical protein
MISWILYALDGRFALVKGSEISNSGQIPLKTPLTILRVTFSRLPFPRNGFWGSSLPGLFPVKRLFSPEPPEILLRYRGCADSVRAGSGGSWLNSSSG